jgi:hypothetical protein
MSPAFRAMVRREMREHAGAALFAFIAVGLFLWMSIAMNHPSPIGSGASFDTRTVTVGSDVTMGSARAMGFSLFGLFTLTSAFAALMIGRAVAKPDRYGDARAFLMHRPMSASEIFFAKMTAAMLLYVIAVGVPLLCDTLWRATPGHIAEPYSVRLALANLADYTVGFVYVLAGMLMALRARAFFDRGLLALGAAVVCSTFVTGVPELWQAELIVIVAIAVMVAAARATFVAIGGYESMPATGRAALALDVGLGWHGVGIFGFGVIGIFSVVASSEPARTTQTAVTGDGRLVRVTSRLQSITRPVPRIVSVTDLAGHPLPEYADSASRATLTHGVLATARMPLYPDRWRYVFDDRGYRGTSRVYTPLYYAMRGAFDPYLYYFVNDRSLIAAYDSRTSRLAGWLGPEGFQAGDTPPRVTFDGEVRPGEEYPYGFDLVAFAHDVYRFDLAHKRVERVFTAPSGETITGAASNRPYEDPFFVLGRRESPREPDTTKYFDAIATTRAVYVQQRDGTGRISVARDSSVNGYGGATVTRATDAQGTPTFVQFEPRDGTLDRGAVRRSPKRVVVVASDGSVTQRDTLPRDEYGDRVSPFNWTVPVGAVMAPLAEHVASWASDVRDGSPLEPIDSPAMLLLSLLGSLIAVGVTVGIGRAYAFSRERMIVWSVLAFAFGFATVLTLITLMSRPARELCPSCGRKRVVTREKCEHCGAEFPAPAADGTEITESFELQRG